MAIKLKRTIYTQSDVIIETVNQDGALGHLGSAGFNATAGKGGGGAGWNHPTGCNAAGPATCVGVSLLNTVQNATMTLNIPRADVNVFGVEGVIARPQLEAETATLEFSWIPETSSSTAVFETLKASDLNALIADTISPNADFCTASSAGVGKIKAALMNSFTGEASVGALPTFTASFTGATNDAANPAKYSSVGGGAAVDGDAVGLYMEDAGAVTANAAPIDIASITTVADVVTPKQIQLFLAAPGAGFGNLLDAPAEPDTSGGSTIVGADTDDDLESCAQSASFSWDVPVETILCLGSDPATDGIALGNPPGTASMTVETLMTQLVGAPKQNYKLVIGAYSLVLFSAEIDSRTHNLAVGDLYGSYNYVLGGTGDGFAVL